MSSGPPLDGAAKNLEFLTKFEQWMDGSTHAQCRSQAQVQQCDWCYEENFASPTLIDISERIRTQKIFRFLVNFDFSNFSKIFLRKIASSVCRKFGNEKSAGAKFGNAAHWTWSLNKNLIFFRLKDVCHENSNFSAKFFHLSHFHWFLSVVSDPNSNPALSF